MKHQFPKKRQDTITRRNITMALLLLGDDAGPDDVAHWIMPSAHKTLAKKRHIERTVRLMKGGE